MRSNHNLKIAALMLYAGEGAKTGKTVDITNGNPSILAVFLKFLRQCCQIDENRVKFYLYCFEDQNIDELINFWCNRLKIDKKQFTKPYVRSYKTSSRKVAKYGILHIRYSDKYLLEEILVNMNRVLKIVGR